MGKFTGKTVLITGAAGNIGKEAARQFHDLGANVVLVDMDPAGLERTAEELGLEADRSALVPADVTREKDVEAYVAEAVRRFGRIDVFFNNAGLGVHRMPIVDLDIDVFERTMQVNVNGMLLGMKYVLRVMYKQGYGSIINTASQAGVRITPEGYDYCISKSGVIVMTKIAAMEAGPHGVRVNAICPGLIDSDMMHNNIRKMGVPLEVFLEGLKRQIPLGTWAKLPEIVNLVVFLASDEASHITGAEIKIDGGSTVVAPVG